jgi:acetyl esterase
MPVDPQIQQMLAMLEQMGGRSLADGTPEQARAGFRLLTVDLRPAEAVLPVGAVEDRTVPVEHGELPARVYFPKDGPEGDVPRPTVVFFHGGGFVIGDLDTHDNQCRMVCRELGAVVLSVAYRVAPEDRFPAAVDDCFAAARWAADHVEELGGDADRIAVAGDSAGGNLAAVVAQLARDAGAPKLAAQLLVYPAVDFRDDDGRYPSRAENAEGYFLTRADMEWFARHYAEDADDTDPRLSPIAGDLAGLPPAVVVTAEFDPLRDEGDAYARALADAGVEVVHRSFPGMIHGFFDLSGLSPAAAEAVRQTCSDLAGMLGVPASSTS